MRRINVTQSFLPPIEDYQRYIKQIWQSGQLTNQGSLLLEFEKKITDYLQVQNIHFVANGTIALQVALKSLDITEGEVITTPFSYVATTSAILWERCKPVYVDIDPNTFCINPEKIEEAITNKTKAILAVHVFGFPCEVETIEAIAKKHNLKVIYDGAHAFGVIYKDKSLLNYGDISISSFHATKPFHTIEGGCIVVKDSAISDKIELIKRFGHTGDNHYTLGINAKASEFQAAMGLCNLKYVGENIKKRKKLSNLYSQLLDIKNTKLAIGNRINYNYSYYPILLKDEKQLLSVLEKLNQIGIFPRRYFFPSLNRLPYIKVLQNCPISENISKRILCLPLYVGLEKSIIHEICEIINKT